MKVLQEVNESDNLHFYMDGNDIFYFDGKNKIKLTSKQKQWLLFLEEQEKKKSDPTYKEEEEDELKVSVEDVFDDIKSGKLADEMGKEAEELRYKLSPEGIHLSQRRAIVNQLAREMWSFVNDQVTEYKANVRDFRKRSHMQDGVDDFLDDDEKGTLFVRSEREITEVPKPSVQLYFDKSSSWDTEFKKDLRERLLSTFDAFADDIDFQPYYFADTIWTMDAPDSDDYRSKDYHSRGTGAGNKIVDEIRRTNPTNVVVVTDGDFDAFHGFTYRVEVPGAAWRVFVGGVSRNLQANLIGKTLTKNYIIWE